MVRVLGDVDQGVDPHPPSLKLPAGHILKKGVHLPLQAVQFLKRISFKKDRHILSSIYQLVMHLYPLS
jgi:hypothetical protein